MQFLRLGSSGMRGKTAEGLTPENVIRYAASLGTYLNGGVIVAGRDSRISSEMFYCTAASSLMNCGCKVIDVGLCSAPELSYYIRSLKADGGIMIGGGHHPEEWNAVIPFNSSGAYFNSVQMQELLDIYHSGEFRSCPWDESGCTVIFNETLRLDYFESLCKHVDADLIASQSYRVVADFCNGPGSKIAALIKKRFNLDLVVINKVRSGILPHSPEPRPRTSYQAQTLLQTLDADAAFVFNSDMSRMSMVTNTGKRLSEEYTFPLILNHLLGKKLQNNTVVTNYCSSRMVDWVVEQYGGTLVKAQVGQSAVVDKMLESGAVVCGEGSGSVALDDHLDTYDSFLAMLLVLEAMASSKKTLQELVQELPEYHIMKRKVNCPAGNGYRLLRGAGAFFPDAKVTEYDGFRFDWQDGWVNLRASKTEPVLRMTVEHRCREKAEDLATQVRGMLERLVAL